MYSIASWSPVQKNQKLMLKVKGARRAGNNKKETREDDKYQANRCPSPYHMHASANRQAQHFRGQH